MKKRPMCLVCLGLALGIWLMRLAGLPVFGEPEKGRLETLVQSEETVQVRGQVQDYEIKDNSKSYLITSCVLKNQENEIPVKKVISDHAAGRDISYGKRDKYRRSSGGDGASRESGTV